MYTCPRPYIYRRLVVNGCLEVDSLDSSMDHDGLCHDRLILGLPPSRSPPSPRETPLLSSITLVRSFVRIFVRLWSCPKLPPSLPLYQKSKQARETLRLTVLRLTNQCDATTAKLSLQSGNDSQTRMKSSCESMKNDRYYVISITRIST